jgi:hypothetical protein
MEKKGSPKEQRYELDLPEPMEWIHGLLSLSVSTPVKH